MTTEGSEHVRRAKAAHATEALLARAADELYHASMRKATPRRDVEARAGHAAEDLDQSWHALMSLLSMEQLEEEERSDGRRAMGVRIPAAPAVASSKREPARRSTAPSMMSRAISSEPAERARSATKRGVSTSEGVRLYASFDAHKDLRLSDAPSHALPIAPDSRQSAIVRPRAAQAALDAMMMRSPRTRRAQAASTTLAAGGGVQSIVQAGNDAGHYEGRGQVPRVRRGSSQVPAPVPVPGPVVPVIPAVPLVPVAMRISSCCDCHGRTIFQPRAQTADAAETAACTRSLASEQIDERQMIRPAAAPPPLP